MTLNSTSAVAREHLEVVSILDYAYVRHGGHILGRSRWLLTDEHMSSGRCCPGSVSTRHVRLPVHRTCTSNNSVKL